MIYPGSIERVDFGEAADDRYFVIADVVPGRAKVDWRKIEGARPFIERRAVLKPESGAVQGSSENVTEIIKAALPEPGELEGAIVKLSIEYPREYEALIDDAALRKYAEQAFEFHLVKRPQAGTRVRLPADQTASTLSPLELLDQYWRASNVDPAEADALQKLAQQVISDELPKGDES